MEKDFCPNCFEEKPSQGVCPHCGYDPTGDQEKFPMALKAGTVLGGKYIIGRVLGEGGFGVTYLAQDYHEKTIVAVKEYFPDSLAARTGDSKLTPFTGEREEAFNYGKECFLEEAKTLSRFIGSETIVRVYSYFEENNTAYFAMEYIHGKSLLDDLNEQGGKLSFEETKKILLPVMDALDLIHGEGIVHRDISPDNVLLTDDGGVKLIDFGAARYSLGDRSRSLDVVLKHGYAPMEQYTRRGRQGPYTDVYALCATMYKCLTGKTPPDAVDRMDEDTLIPPSTLGVSIPQQAEDALMKGLSIQYRDRYQSIRELKTEMFSENKGQISATVEKEKTEPTPNISVSQETKTQNDNVLQAPQDPPPQSADPVKSKKSVNVKKLLAIGIPILAVILAVVIALTVVLPKTAAPATDETVGEEEQEVSTDENGNIIINDGVYQLGDTWTVEDQWSFTIKGIYELSDREPDHNTDISDPEAVYLIDYEYHNLGYYNEAGANAGANSYFDPTKLTMGPSYDLIEDSAGEAAFAYILSFPSSTENISVGDVGREFVVFGVNHRGALSCTVRHSTDQDHGAERHQATFRIAADEAPLTSAEGVKYGYQVLENAVLLEIGKTWTVEDQWSLTINSVTKTDERYDSSIATYEAAEVYVIDYTYTNINYVTDDDGDGDLYFYFYSHAVDSAGVNCEYYHFHGLTYDQAISPGETFTCQDVIAVSQPGGFKVENFQIADKKHGDVFYQYGFYYDMEVPSSDAADQPSDSGDAITYTETDFGDFTVQLPSNWTYEVENGGIYFYESYVHAHDEIGSTGYLCDIVGIDPKDADTLRPNARQLGQAGSVEYYVQFPMGIGVIEDETAKEKMNTAYDQVETFVQSVIMK